MEMCYFASKKNIRFIGGELDLMKPRVIAACNRRLANQLVELFNEADTKPININLTRNC